MERRQEEDRRKVERVSNPAIREQLRLIGICLKVLMTVTLFKTVYHLVDGFSDGASTEVAFGLFLAVIFISIFILLFRYSAAIKDFLFNESYGNLEKAFERQATFWIATCFLSVIWIIGLIIYSL